MVMIGITIKNLYFYKLVEVGRVVLVNDFGFVFIFLLSCKDFTVNKFSKNNPPRTCFFLGIQ